MARLIHLCINIGLDLLWRLRPHAHDASLAHKAEITSPKTSHGDDLSTLRSLVRRFPFWKQGRYLLAEQSLRANEIATAYAEAQALRRLSSKGSHLYAISLLLLGRCFLRKGEGHSALLFLNEAHSIEPHNHRIQEERSAALVLDGDKATALTILRTIPDVKLSAEGKAALAWLSSTTSQYGTGDA